MDDSVKKAESLNYNECEIKVKELVQKGSIQPNPPNKIFHCNYEGASASLTPNDICWKMNESRGNAVSEYCTNSRDIPVAGAAVAENYNSITGRCCYSTAMTNPTTGYKTFVGLTETESLQSCLERRSDWRNNQADTGVFDIQFCPHLQTESTTSDCGLQNNGWKNTNCGAKIPLNIEQTREQINAGISAWRVLLETMVPQSGGGSGTGARRQ